MNPVEIREQRAAKVAAARALLFTADTEKRALTADESARFDAIKAEITDLESQEQRASFLADAERRSTNGERVAGSGDARFDAELRSFSLTRAIAAQLPGSTVDAGREREISAELARRSGQKFAGIAVPLEVFEQRVTTPTAPVGGPGSNLIGTDHRGDLYFDRLRAKLRVRQLGATVLSGLQGNVEIPGLKSSTTAGWVADNAALAPSDPSFRKVTLSPKHCGAITEFSRNMLLQSSPDVEQLVRNDFALVLAEAMDVAAVQGAGGNAPTGILNTAGIQTGTLAGPTWAQVLGIVEKIELANADATGWYTNPSVVRKLRSTPVVAGYPEMIQDDPGTLAGYNLVTSTLLPNAGSPLEGTAIFGNWADLLIGYWSAFDLLINPYESTAYAKGNVQVRAMLTADVAVRHPESFVVANDVPLA